MGKKNMPNFISKNAQRGVGKYKVKFTCPKNYRELFEIIPIN